MGSPGNRPAFSIRTAREEDAPGILECLRVAFEPYRAAYSKNAFEDTVLTPETISRRLAEMTVFAAINESGDVIGTIACKLNGREGHLRGMAVRTEWMGSGLAAQLLNAAEEHLRDRGCTRVTLNTTAPLKRAMRFYGRHGYRESGKVRDFFGMPLYGYEKVMEDAK